MEVDYLKEAKLGDTLTIKTCPYQLGNTSFSFKQKIYNQNEELLTKNTIILVMFDINRRKSIQVPEEIVAQF